MPRSHWLQRVIALFDAAALGFVTDRLTHSPLWGMAAGLAGMTVFIWLISRPPLSERLLKFDRDASETLRTVVLSILFFILCAAGAALTLAQ